MNDIRIVEPQEIEAHLEGRVPDFSQYERLLEAVAEKTKRIEAAHPDQFACRSGCHHCCQAVPTVLPVEWAYLRMRDRRPRSGLASLLHPGEPLCDRLDERGACAIYEVRPMVCRTQGHLFATADGGLDHCPWNFQGLDEVDESEVFDLERLHETLLRVNLDFLRRVWPERYSEMAVMRVRFHAE